MFLALISYEARINIAKFIWVSFMCKGFTLILKTTVDVYFSRTVHIQSERNKILSFYTLVIHFFQLPSMAETILPSIEEITKNL